MGGGGFSGIRNAAEAIGADVGNYFAPGSSLITDQAISKGAQQIQSSPLGEVGQLGSGLAGAGVGSSVTGIPASPSLSSDWANITGALGGGAPSTGVGIDPNMLPANYTQVAGETGGGGALSTPSEQAGVNALSQNAAPPVATPDTSVTDPYSLATKTTGLNVSSGGLNPSSTTSGLTMPQQASLGNMTAGGTAPTTGTGSGIWNTIKSGASDVGFKSPLQAGELGLMAHSMMSQPSSQLNPTLMNMAAPASAVSQQLLSNFQNGQMTAADQANIASFKQEQTAAIKQQYAQAGLSGSSMEQQALSGIEQQATQMEQQALQNQLSQATQAAGISNPIVSSAVNAQIQQDQQAQQAQQNLMKAMAMMSAGGGGSNV